MSYRIETLLSARSFMSPQVADGRIYFISNISGHLSLYVMDHGGSVPQPLLPPNIVLQNPHLMAISYWVYPALGRILLMLDDNGDENYQPMLIPIDGGIPEPAFGDRFAGYRVHLSKCVPERAAAYFSAESRTEPMNITYQANLETGELAELYRSAWGGYVGAASADQTKLVIGEGYTIGDNVLFLREAGADDLRLLLGKPLAARAEGEQVPLTGIGGMEFTPDDQGLLIVTTLFDDAGGLGYIHLAQPGQVSPVRISGLVHQGAGEMDRFDHLRGSRYLVGYNIDGCSWLYEGGFDPESLEMRLDQVICGQGETSGGVLDARYYDKQDDRHALTFSTATSPTQIYTVEGAGRELLRHTRERILGVPADALSPGVDASFTSYDGLRISARLYLPAETLDFSGPRPLVYYIHGGPQSQERPDFTWFSMPLIQFLTLNGFAVFVPNVRGSSGYGMQYMKHVDRDWGGKDRLDHVHAMKLLADDPRVDASRTGVAGRSYGGYMTLTLAARHPELWSAAVDMFGPYDLLTFMARIPETWKPYFAIAVGDPVKDRDFLLERSPRTHIDQIACPLLVIQGKNDPRVIEQESRDVVEQLRARDRQVDYLMFEDEGHDVLKFNNRVTCYNAITAFFKRHLMP